MPHKQAIVQSQPKLSMFGKKFCLFTAEQEEGILFCLCSLTLLLKLLLPFFCNMLVLESTLLEDGFFCPGHVSVINQKGFIVVIPLQPFRHCFHRHVLCIRTLDCVQWTVLLYDTLNILLLVIQKYFFDICDLFNQEIPILNYVSTWCCSGFITKCIATVKWKNIASYVQLITVQR